MKKLFFGILLILLSSCSTISVFGNDKKLSLILMDGAWKRNAVYCDPPCTCFGIYVYHFMKNGQVTRSYITGDQKSMEEVEGTWSVKNRILYTNSLNTSGPDRYIEEFKIGDIDSNSMKTETQFDGHKFLFTKEVYSLEPKDSSKTLTVANLHEGQKLLVCPGVVEGNGYPRGHFSYYGAYMVLLDKDPSLIKFSNVKTIIEKEKYKSLEIPTNPVCKNPPTKKIEPAKKPKEKLELIDFWDYCDIKQENDEITISTSWVQGAFGHFKLNTKSLTLDISSGGIDGGWGFTGSCEVVPLENK